MPEEGVRRIGSDKLGARIEPTRLIGVATGNRGDYQLVLMEFEARVLSGEPNVLGATGPGTRYVNQQWTDRLEVLADAAGKGSLCCQIFLNAATESATGS